MKYLLISTLMVLVFFVKAQSNTPKYSNEFLSIGVGARSFGLGGSAVSYIDDVTSGYWNPAGLMHIEEKYQMSLMHASYFAGIANFDYASFSGALDSTSRYAFSIVRLAVDDIPDTRLLFNNNGSIDYDNVKLFTAADYAFIGSYARKMSILGGITFGGNIKIIHRLVGNFASAWGFGMDVGMQKQLGAWQTGLVIRDVFTTFNAWSHNSSELQTVYAITNNEIPENSIEITLPKMIMGTSRAWIISNNFNLMAALDLDVTFDGKRNTLIKSSIISMDPHGGVELGYGEKFFLRLGVNQFQQTRNFNGSQTWTFQPNLGLGINLKDLTIDYAFTDVGDVSEGLWSHIFSIKVNFYEQ